jgi:hypothetical protein
MVTKKISKGHFGPISWELDWHRFHVSTQGRPRLGHFGPHSGPKTVETENRHDQGVDDWMRSKMVDDRESNNGSPRHLVWTTLYPRSEVKGMDGCATVSLLCHRLIESTIRQRSGASGGEDEEGKGIRIVSTSVHSSSGRVVSLLSLYFIGVLFYPNDSSPVKMKNDRDRSG